MDNMSPATEQLQSWIARLQSGDPSARDELIQHSCERLRRLARQMLRGFPGVKQWQDTDDVFQNAMLRLWKALAEIQPKSVAEYLGLASLQLRRELIDLARHFKGPEHGRLVRIGDQAESGAEPAQALDELTHEPCELARWTELHAHVAQLPPPEREVFDLLWYQELPQADAASLLQVSVPTIKRRWLAARRRLQHLLKEA
jgi:RNA polymerase sigma factor (sigma-70 family)